ncbi:MAG: aminotransferase class I/II-fold pyridoxal phosphate-dependent enzyme, partial [Candidatus Micrarchaeaceae archaeon]
AQYAVANTMLSKEHFNWIKKFAKEIKERTTYATKLVNESRFMQAVLPQGAFYVFPKVNMKILDIKDDKEFVNKLLIEKQVWLTRGSGFGSKNHVRIVALPNKETLSLAMSKIDEFCNAHEAI